MSGPLGRTLSRRTVEGLPVGDRDAVFWDRALPGFGVRIYPSGARVYVVQTRVRGRSRRVTVGRHGVLSPAGARRRAALILARLKAGQEPAPPLARAPKAGFGSSVTVAGLAERYMREHVAVRCKPSTAECYRSALATWILPAIGGVAAGAVERAQIAALHYRLRAIPYRANQVVNVLNRMFALAEAWGLRPDGSNPCGSIRKYREHRRERFLSQEEFRRLGRVLDEFEDEGRRRGGGRGSIRSSAVAALRLLMLTGCRRNEILTLRWEDVDWKAGELRLRDSKTGARAVPLPRCAAHVLSGLPASPATLG